MGRGGKRGGRGGKKGAAAGRSTDKDGAPKVHKRDTDDWGAKACQENAKFETYYKAQNIVPDEEWAPFMAALHEPLPTTFRITGCREVAASVNQLIQDTYVPFLSGLEHEGNPLSPPRPLDWYPKGWAWQLNIAKQHIRKNEAFRKFQNFLVYETDAGNLSRQEAVSMIPPLLLDVQPHHYVLDVCAAPGSKSVQLLEALQMPREATIDSTPDRASPGLLIANDSDAKRCHMLVHQSLHRIPAAGMMVTNHDASQMPGFRLPHVAQAGDSAPHGKKYEPLLFDRILADVPCSGDGTLRKNIGIWRDWTVGNGTGLHSLQLRILLRAIAMLKPGGRLVYSTCSLNPVENEAVVSAALEACPEMTLVAVPEMLPSLIRRPGLTTWQVLNNDLVDAVHPNDFDSTGLEADELKRRKKFLPSLWPNGKEAERGLDRCLRIYPHLQDTGAFFVSVLTKAEAPVKVVTASAPAVASEVPKRTATERASSPVVGEPSSKRARQEDAIADDTPVDSPAAEVEEAEPKAEVVEEIDVSTLPAEVAGTTSKAAAFKEDPFTYLSPEDDQVKTCLDFFDLDPSFPVANLLVRNASGTALRSIYFTSPIVRSLLLNNSYTRMRLISCGVKVFTRQDSGKDGTYRCKWRVVSEGLEVIRPFMGPKRIVQGTKETLRTLMGELNVPFGEFKGTEFLTRLEGMEPGSCVLEITTTGEGVELEQKLVLPLWRSVVSTSLMVEKMEKSALSLRIFGEDLTPNKLVEKARDVKKLELAAAAAAATASGEATPDAVATPVATAVAEVVEEVKESVVVVE